MKNWKISPKDSYVANYVECYWFLEKTVADNGPSFPKLNPDPAGHFIIACPQQRYRYEQNSSSITGYGSHLIFPHSKTILIDHSQPFLIIGIKFHVGALYSLNFSNTKTDLDQIIGTESGKILKLEACIGSDLLAQVTDQPEKCSALLNERLMPWLLDSHEDKHSKLVRNALQINSNVPISEMGEALNCSQRTLERSFSRVTGLTLKQYRSMNRLEAILNYVYKLDSSDINWSDVAAKFGFSDHPHLIRHLKSSIGSTPGNYAKQRDLTIDAYGSFEET